MLPTQVPEAPEIVAPVLPAPVLLALLEMNTVHKLLNFKGIYAVLSRIWKCRKSRVFSANFLVQKLVGAYFMRFYDYDPPSDFFQK